MPVPLAEVGSLVEGMEQDEELSGLSLTIGRGDRKLGGLAQYEVCFSLSLEGFEALGDEEEERVLERVTQVVVLLGDVDAAARSELRGLLEWYREVLGRIEAGAIVEPGEQERLREEASLVDELLGVLSGHTSPLVKTPRH